MLPLLFLADPAVALEQVAWRDQREAIGIAKFSEFGCGLE